MSPLTAALRAATLPAPRLATAATAFATQRLPHHYVSLHWRRGDFVWVRSRVHPHAVVEGAEAARQAAAMVLASGCLPRAAAAARVACLFLTTNADTASDDLKAFDAEFKRRMGVRTDRKHSSFPAYVRFPPSGELRDVRNHPIGQPLRAIEVGIIYLSNKLISLDL